MTPEEAERYWQIFPPAQAESIVPLVRALRIKRRPNAVGEGGGPLRIWRAFFPRRALFRDVGPRRLRVFKPRCPVSDAARIWKAALIAGIRSSNRLGFQDGRFFVMRVCLVASKSIAVR